METSDPSPQATAEPAGSGQGDRADRQMTVLINAGVSQGACDGICRIRNISDHGMAIETACALVADEEAVVTLSSGRTLVCLVRWVEDGRAGMSCGANVRDVIGAEGSARASVPQAGALQNGGTPNGGPALPRFYRDIAVMVSVHGRMHRCSLDSLSLHDILLVDAPPLHRSEQLMVDIAGLGSFMASACISVDGDLFARFTAPLPFQRLDQWLGGHNGASLTPFTVNSGHGLRGFNHIL